MISTPELEAKGYALLHQLHGAGAEQALRDDVADLCPDFFDMTVCWALGGITARPGLDLVTRELVVIASCVTLGHASLQLKAHSEAALRAGATQQQIIETILQLTFYAGGAAVRNALTELKEVLSERSEDA